MKRLRTASLPKKRMISSKWQGSNGMAFLGTNRGYRLRSGFQSRDLGQHRRCFVFKRTFHRQIIALGKLSRLELKIKVAQIFVDYFITFAKVRGAGLFRTG